MALLDQLKDNLSTVDEKKGSFFNSTENHEVNKNIELLKNVTREQVENLYKNNTKTFNNWVNFILTAMNDLRPIGEPDKYIGIKARYIEKIFEIFPDEFLVKILDQNIALQGDTHLLISNELKKFNEKQNKHKEVNVKEESPVPEVVIKQEGREFDMYLDDDESDNDNSSLNSSTSVKTQRANNYPGTEGFSNENVNTNNISNNVDSGNTKTSSEINDNFSSVDPRSTWSFDFIEKLLTGTIEQLNNFLNMKKNKPKR